MNTITKIGVSCLFLCGVLLPAQAQLTQAEKAKCDHLMKNKAYAEQECRNALLLLEKINTGVADQSAVSEVGGTSGADLQVNVKNSAAGNLGLVSAGYANPYPAMTKEQQGEWKKRAATLKSTYFSNPQEFDTLYEKMDEDQKAVLYAAAKEEYKESVTHAAEELLSRVSATTGWKKTTLSVNDLRFVLDQGDAQNVSATLRANPEGLDLQHVDEQAAAAKAKVAKYAAFLKKVENCKNCKPADE